ncbi:hypothetical protein Saso_64030 [Streptomyces asoensis]|uniref:Uncharacterized protein n=1 Tax=Streptomyces asoensis TaxID=249586 RepID=A0ABQ3S9E3_9ACTN|nr:hypothetical protein Saso_64030 [Streptomyces asoensis]
MTASPWTQAAYSGVVPSPSAAAGSAPARSSRSIPGPPPHIAAAVRRFVSFLRRLLFTVADPNPAHGPGRRNFHGSRTGTRRKTAKPVPVIDLFPAHPYFLTDSPNHVRHFGPPVGVKGLTGRYRRAPASLERT